MKCPMIGLPRARHCAEGDHRSRRRSGLADRMLLLLHAPRLSLAEKCSREYHSEFPILSRQRRFCAVGHCAVQLCTAWFILVFLRGKPCTNASSGICSPRSAFYCFLSCFPLSSTTRRCTRSFTGG